MLVPPAPPTSPQQSLPPLAESPLDGVTPATSLAFAPNQSVLPTEPLPVAPSPTPFSPPPTFSVPQMNVVSPAAPPLSPPPLPPPPVASPQPSSPASFQVTPPQAQQPTFSAAPTFGGTGPLSAAVPTNLQQMPAPAPAAAPYASILDVLVSRGKLTPDQVAQVQAQVTQSNRPPEAILDDLNLVSDIELLEAKAEFLHMPFVRVEDTGVSPEVLSIISESVARRYGMLPFALDKMNRTIAVAMKNPLDLAAIDFVEKKTGYKLLPHFASPSQVDQKIMERYSQNISSEVNAALKESTQEDTRSLDNLAALSKEVIREAPIAKIIETILAFAIQARASDVHIEPLEDRTRVRYRIDGILAEKLVLPKNVHEALASRVKILSDLKIDEKRLPQDGRFTFTANGQTVDLRVSTLPTVHGEKVVLRLLQKNLNVPSLSDLGLRGLALKAMEEAMRVPHGIILITGPTGSGKTTTLYSLLHGINTPKVNIVTLEDPVEYQMVGVNQVQINPQAGLTFASGLRAFLRQDPNVIMVGEIRDSETAELAIQASLTGHLVFSTLHTNSAAGALPRLVDMGAEPFLLASSVTLCASQRVVRKINPNYREAYVPDPEVIADIKAVLGPLFDSWCAQGKIDPAGNTVQLYRPMANRPENEPEYKGRIAIFEAFKMTEEMGRLVIEHRPAAEIEATAVKGGMLLMKQDGYLKALDGITTLEEVMRVAEV